MTEVLMYFTNVIKTISTLILIVTAYGVYAQENSTPTPAPSKTPTTVPDSQIEQSTQEPVQLLIQPWTQSDLSILTGNVQRPNGLVWHNNKLYTACNGDFTVYEIDDVTGSTRTYIWGVRNAHTLYAETTAENELNLWVPDFEANQLVRVDRNGVDTIVSDLDGPWGIAHLNETEFLLTSLRGNSLIQASRDGQSRAILTDLRSPTGITTDDQYVYVANTGSARRAIEWINKGDIPSQGSAPDSEIVTHPLISGLQNTTGLVMAGDGYLYFAYSLGTRGVVGRVNPEVCRSDAGCTNDQVEIVLYTELAAPLAGLTITPDMRLFVHTMFSPDIYWLKLNANPESDDYRSTRP
jgi:hypothetical protein